MKKILKCLPEIFIVLGVTVILAVIIHMNILLGLLSLGLILIVAGFISAKAREAKEARG